MAARSFKDNQRPSGWADALTEQLKLHGPSVLPDKPFSPPSACPKDLNCLSTPMYDHPVVYRCCRRTPACP